MDATESVQPSNSKKPPKRRSRSSGVGILRSAKPLEDIENVLKEEKSTRNRRVSFCNTVEVKEFGLAEEPEAGTSRKHPPSDPVDSDIQISTPACKRQRRISDLKVKMGRLSIIPKLDKSICGDDACEDFDVLADDFDDPKKENAVEVPPVSETQQGEETSQHAEVLQKQPCDANTKVASSPIATHTLLSELGEADMSLTLSLATHEPCPSTFVKPNRHVAELVKMTFDCVASPSSQIGDRRHGTCVGENTYSEGQHYRTELEPVEMSLTLSPVGCGDGVDGASHLATPLTTKARVDISLTKADMSLDPDESKVGMSFTCVAPNANMSPTYAAFSETRTEPSANCNRPLHSTTCLNPIDMSLISSPEPVRNIASLRQLQNGPQGMPPNCNHIPSEEKSFVGAVADEIDTSGSADMDFTCMDDTLHSQSMHEAPLASSTVAVLRRPEPTIAATLTALRPAVHDRSAGPAQLSLEQGANEKAPADIVPANATECQSGPTSSCHGLNSSSANEDLKLVPPSAENIKTSLSTIVSRTSANGPSDTNCYVKRSLPAINASVVANDCSSGQPLSVGAQQASYFSFSGNADVAHTAFEVAVDTNGVEVRSEEEVLLVADSQATSEADNGDGQASVLEEEPWTEIVAEEIIDEDQYIVSASHVLCPENMMASHVLNGGNCHSPQVSHNVQVPQQCIPVVSEPQGMARNMFVHEPSLAMVQSTHGYPALSTSKQPQGAQQQSILDVHWEKTSVTQPDAPSERDERGPRSSTQYHPAAADQSCAPALPSLSRKGREEPPPQMQHCVLPPPAEQPRDITSLPPKPRNQSLGVHSAHSTAQPLGLSAQQRTSLDQPSQNDSRSLQNPPFSAPLLHKCSSSQSTANNSPSTHDWLHPASSIALQMKLGSSREGERAPLLQAPNDQTSVTQAPKNQPTLSTLPQKQTLHPSLFQKQMGQPPLSQKQAELPPVFKMQVDQLPMFQKQMEQPSVSMRQIEQPSVSMRQIEQPSVSMRQVEQPSVSLRQMEQPSASVKQMEQPSGLTKQMEQPPVSWDHLQSALREHLSSANNNLILPLNCTFSKSGLEHQGQRESIVPFNTNVVSPLNGSLQIKPCNPTVSSTITKVPRTGLLTDLGDTSNWLQSSALDYSIPLIEESCDSPSFAVRQRAAMQHECSSKHASREASLCVTEGETGEGCGLAEGFDLNVFQEDLTDLRHKLLAVLRELSSRWKVERSGLMQDAILHLFLSASIYLGGISFLREYGISSGVLLSECSSTAVNAPFCTGNLRRVQWLQKVYTEVKQLHERTVSIIKRAPRIYPWVLVVWSENLVEVKVPASEAVLEIQLETKVDVMQGAFSQSITEFHWGSTAASKPSNVPKPSNADDILKVIEKITKRDLFSDHNEVMCM